MSESAAAASPEYIAARRVLLDVLSVLSEHTDAFVLVGAQAVYINAPLGDSRPAFTTDSDLAINPELLAGSPNIAAELESAGFSQGPHANPGHWLSGDGVAVDLMVPDALLPPPSRAQRGTCRSRHEHGTPGTGTGSSIA